MNLRERIAAADALLAPYAIPHQGGLGRAFPEAPDETRFPFQRDRDRILHTQAFRRLKHKTQVFVAGHGDHYRTRITHTLEVCQISRDVARTLGLNEDLAEAIALAHDLGHTPFGHAGEEALSQCMQKFGKTFEHNEQSLRIVILLETRSTKYPGLNLNREILEGLKKHRTPHDTPRGDNGSRSLSLEAQIVNLADEIAYTAHDTDDGLRATLFDLAAIRKMALGKMASERAKAQGTEVRGALVHLLVLDLYEETGRRLLSQRIHSLADVYDAPSALVSFSPPMQGMLTELRKFLWDHLYTSPSVQRQANHGKKIIAALFSHYLKHPPTKVKTLKERSGGALEVAVKDYIAGMTDPYAITAFQSLGEVIPQSKKGG